VALSVSAPLFKTALSPGDLGQLDFIQGMLGAAIKDMLVEPRRIAVSLDTEIRVEEVGMRPWQAVKRLFWGFGW
jgi:hypothetical protein